MGKDEIIIHIENPGTICVGIQRESEVTRVLFDVSSWQNNPILKQGGKYILQVKRPGEEEIHTAELPVSGKYAIWDVSDFYLQKAGTGCAELTYRAEDQCKKTDIMRTQIEGCLA